MHTTQAAAEPITPVRLDRFKHGRELRLDARRVDHWTGIGCGVRPHTLDFHEVLVVREGRARVETDGRELSVAGPAVLVTGARQVRRIEADRAVALHLLVFDDEALVRAGHLAGLHGLGRGLVAPGPERVNALAGVVDQMAGEIGTWAAGADRMLDLLLARALILLGRASRRVPPAPLAPPVVLKLEALVEEHFREQHEAGWYAAALAVSADHLSALVRRHRGFAVKALVQRRLLFEAQRLLRDTDQTVSEIAFALGYDDPGQFSRAFRTGAGISPSRYRQRIAENAAPIAASALHTGSRSHGHLGAGVAPCAS